MRIVRVAIRDFLSVGDEEIEFDRKGIIFVKGINQDAPGASSNGAGKSALLDAVLWAAYGTTLRDVGTDDVIRKGAKRAGVELEVEAGASRYRIIRTRGDRTSLEILKGQKSIARSRLKDAQAQVNRIIGYDKDAFVAAVAFGHEIARFARLPDAEKKRLLEKLLGFDVFERALRITRARISETQREIETDMNMIARCDDRIASGERELTALRKERDEWAEQQAERLSRLKDHVEEIEGRLKKKRARARKLDEKEIGKSRKRLRLAEEKIESALFEAKHNYRSEIPEERRIEEIDKEIKRVGRLSGRCPTCKQKITKGCVEEVKLELGGERESLEKKIRAEKKRKMKLRKEVASLEATQRQIEHDLEEVSRGYGEAKSLAEEIESLESSRGALVRQCDELGSKPPQNSAIRRLKRELDGTKKSRSEHARSVKGSQKTLDDLRFWEEGFGLRGLRSLILDQVLPRLQSLADKYLKALTGSTLRVKFSAVSELKSGESRDALSIKVINSFGAPEYGGNSAGERARADLAIALALFDLVRERSGGGVGFAFFDEVFESLDEAGCEAVASLLKRTCGKWGSVFVVSHLDSLADSFERRLSVVKKDGISRIQNGRPKRERKARVHA